LPVFAGFYRGFTSFFPLSWQKYFLPWQKPNPAENYRQSYSIRTVKDWNALPQSVMSAGSLALRSVRLGPRVICV